MLGSRRSDAEVIVPVHPQQSLALDDGRARAHGLGIMRNDISSLAPVFAQPDLRYAILHGWQSLLNARPSDVDIATTPDDLLRIEETLRRGASAQVVQLIQHEASCYYFVLAVREREHVRFVALDVAVDYRGDGCIFFQGKELLRGRQRVDGLWVAAPPIEFAYLLIKKICKKDLPEDQKARLRALQHMLGGEAVTIARQILGARWGEQVIRWMAWMEWVALEARLPALKRALRWQTIKHSPFNPIQYWMSELRRWWQRWRYPTGLFVAVLGSDGSGKSTLIEHLKVDLAGAFRRVTVSHLRPSLVERKVAAPPVTDPHGRAVYPPWLAWLKIPHYALIYLLGYLVRIRPRLTCSTLVLFDRYYDDLLVDPRRYRYGGPMGLARFARRFTGKPDLLLVLDVPEERLLERKQEVALDELRRQRDAYRQLAADLPYAVILDGSLPAADVAQKARDVVLDYLHRRYMHRRSLWFPEQVAEMLKSLEGAPAPASPRGGFMFSRCGPSRPASPGSGSQTFGWFALEHGRGYLIPLAPRRAAIAALGIYNAQTLKARLAKTLLKTGLTLGVTGPWLRRVQFVSGGKDQQHEGIGNDFLRYLKEILRRPDALAAISLGTPGPSRKPVLLVLTGEGEPLAYVKVGSNGTTNELVRREAEMLKFLSGHSFRSFIAPDVLHAGWWNGRYVSVQSPIPEGSRRHPPARSAPPYATILQELAAVHVRWLTLKDSEFWKLVVRQVETVSATRYRDPLARGLQTAERWFQGVLLPFHLSHGDFIPWNMKRCGERMLLYDWEHASAAAPPGWDLFHFIFETASRRRRSAREICAALLGETPSPARVDDYFAASGLSATPRERLLFLYVLARLASWAVVGAAHVARFDELQTLVHLLHVLESEGQIGEAAPTHGWRVGDADAQNHGGDAITQSGTIHRKHA